MTKNGKASGTEKATHIETRTFNSAETVRDLIGDAITDVVKALQLMQIDEDIQSLPPARRCDIENALYQAQDHLEQAHYDAMTDSVPF